MLEDIYFYYESIKFSIPLAGFLGGVVYVAFVGDLTRVQVFVSILLGTITAVYLTPLFVSHISKWTGIKYTLEMQAGVAFIIGLTALHIIPSIIRKVKFI